MQHIQIDIPPIALIRPDPVVPIILNRPVEPDNPFAAVTPAKNNV